MHEEIASRLDEIAGLCRSHGVKRLEIFGSAARGTDFDPERSDADFLVELGSLDAPDIADRYFGLRRELAALLGRKVDLLTHLPDNRYLVAHINECRELVYEA